MTDSIWVRLSDMHDAEALMELDSLVWDERNTPGQIKWDTREHYLRKCPPGSQLVAGIGECVCGYLGFAPPTPLPSNLHVYDINIAIDPSCRRQGVGRKLMDAVKQLAAERGVRKLSLRVLASNPGAVAFYQSCGFIEQGRLKEEFYLGGRYVDDILMWYKIE